MGKTIEQAMLTWCPQSRAIQLNKLGELMPGTATYNRLAKPASPLIVPAECACLGPGCAMWNWDSELQDTGDCGLKLRPSITVPESPVTAERKP